MARIEINLLSNSLIIQIAAVCLYKEFDYKLKLIDKPLKSSGRLFSINYSSQKLLDRIGIWENLNINHIIPYDQINVFSRSNALISFKANDINIKNLGFIVQEDNLVKCVADAISSIKPSPTKNISSNTLEIIGNLDECEETKNKIEFDEKDYHQTAVNIQIRHSKNNNLIPTQVFYEHEILGFLQQPLNDLCISRPKERLNWGIELPFDKKYVTYVWFDALINYITAAGYNKKTKNVEKWWPASCHLIGKDILTTHAVYWPTMLFSAGIDLPHSIFAHGWWLMEDAKMSKSIGNVINPMDLLDTYGVDSFRYYLMREMVLGHDSNFTIESFKKRYNSDLANDFGNCFSRVTTLINKNFNGIIPKTGTLDNLDHKIKSKGQALPDLVSNMIDNMRLNEAIEEIMQYVRSVNKYMEKTAPWKIIKEDKYTAGKILYVSCEALRLSAVLLSPIMPHRTKTMLDILNVKGGNPSWGKLPSGNKIKEHTPIFPRIK